MKKETIIKSTIIIILSIVTTSCISFLLYSEWGRSEESQVVEPETVETADLDTEERSETEQQEIREPQFNWIEARDYLKDEISELEIFSHYVHEKTGGQAYLQVEWMRELDLKAIYQNEVFLGNYYIYYISELWPDHVENGIWFYVRDDLGEILCKEDDTEELYTLEEWRASDGYADRMEAISQWQQEKMELLLASEGEGLDEPWYEAYRSFVIDWTRLETYYDLGYLKYYFDEDYQFDSYFLCDVDRNGTPEFFLYSDTRNMKNMVVIMTYTDQPVGIIKEMIHGINLETGEIIVHGHWHGAGGSGIDEYSGFCIQGDTFENTMSIDAYRKEYYPSVEEELYYVSYLGRPDTKERYTDRQEYEEVYAERVESCTLIEDIVKYDLTDLSGLKDIQ